MFWMKQGLAVLWDFVKHPFHSERVSKHSLFAWKKFLTWMTLEFSMDATDRRGGTHGFLEWFGRDAYAIPKVF